MGQRMQSKHHQKKKDEKSQNIEQDNKIKRLTFEKLGERFMKKERIINGLKYSQSPKRSQNSGK